VLQSPAEAKGPPTRNLGRVWVAEHDSRRHTTYPSTDEKAGHGSTVFAGLSKQVDLKLVRRLESGSGTVAMRYAPRR
jgi:hypothetical protein